LDLALADPQFAKVKLTAHGATFSTGGAIEEFGEVADPATAHWVRSLRLPAWRLARLRDKLEVHVNGAAIGAGAEMAAFGSHVTASPKAWFQLPELKYGLIPGAGGTVSVPRRIGRQKTAYMALSMEKIRAETALEWGLIDAIID
jgi:enoyl-CoA hydratase/carnithine racemase